jgi:actin-related protein
MSDSVIIDVGSFSTKVGMSGEDLPRVVFQTVLGRPKVVEDGEKSTYIADEVKTYFTEKQLKVTFPVTRGRTIDAEGLELMFHHTVYNELRVGPEEQPLILLENLFEDDKERAKKTEIIFESCGFPALFLGASSVFAFSTFGVATGVLQDSGHETTHYLIKKDHQLLDVISREEGGKNLFTNDPVTYYLEYETERTKLEGQIYPVENIDETGFPLYYAGGNGKTTGGANLGFLGAAQLASLGSFDQLFMEQHDYEEIGIQVLDRCPRVYHFDFE